MILVAWSVRTSEEVGVIVYSISARQECIPLRIGAPAWHQLRWTVWHCFYGHLLTRIDFIKKRDQEASLQHIKSTGFVDVAPIRDETYYTISWMEFLQLFILNGLKHLQNFFKIPHKAYIPHLPLHTLSLTTSPSYQYTTQLYASNMDIQKIRL